LDLVINHLTITLLLLFAINLIAYLYSYLIVSRKLGKNSQIQPDFKIDKQYLYSHTLLFVVNVLTLMFFVFIGFSFFKEIIIDLGEISVIGILVQLFIILIFDDTFFYVLHRYMHENKYIYSKIHKIHHRANSPVPIDYIYVHPLEWMSGFIGPFIGIIALGGVSIYTFWLYLFVRNFHEIAIHSGLKTFLFNKIFPLYGTNEHHDMHHAKRDCNYSSTFTFWDHVFKTKI
jgi:sterol desaturase/sphingolipid hydroxylase (fatty acid hydroxylase superfamily)